MPLFDTSKNYFSSQEKELGLLGDDEVNGLWFHAPQFSHLMLGFLLQKVNWYTNFLWWYWSWLFPSIFIKGNVYDMQFNLLLVLPLDSKEKCYFYQYKQYFLNQGIKILPYLHVLWCRFLGQFDTPELLSFVNFSGTRLRN